MIGGVVIFGGNHNEVQRLTMLWWEEEYCYVRYAIECICTWKEYTLLLNQAGGEP